jgi:hypothetical protein
MVHWWKPSDNSRVQEEIARSPTPNWRCSRRCAEKCPPILFIFWPGPNDSGRRVSRVARRRISMTGPGRVAVVGVGTVADRGGTELRSVRVLALAAVTAAATDAGIAVTDLDAEILA